MEVHEMPLVRQAQHAQHARHRACPRHQHRTHEQQLGMAPGSLTKQPGEAQNDLREAGRYSSHDLLPCPGKKSVYEPVRFAFTALEWPKSSSNYVIIATSAASQNIWIMSTSDQSMSRTAVAEILRPRLMRITVAMRREMMSASVTTAQSAVLSALLIGQPMRVSDLARNEGVKLPTMTQIIGRMEAAGLVSRTSPPGTYNNLIRITSAGEAVARDLAKQRTELLARRMEDLTSDELALLHQVATVLDKMFTKEPWREASGSAEQVADFNEPML